VPKVSGRKKTDMDNSPCLHNNYLCILMSLKPTIRELEDETAYEKVLTLSYSDLAPFVIGSLKSRTTPMIIIWIAVAVSAFLTVWFWPGIHNKVDRGIIMGLVTGLVIVPLLLVPLHEGLHLIPYRLAGARDIRIGADLRQGVIYVTAHRFVAGLCLFTIVAFLPFIMISAGMAVLISVCSPWWQWALSLSLFAHTTMCAGDAALLAFMWGFNHRNVFTWDDADAREAYFYASKEKSNAL
jgi:hypothetical protein